jgi:hypothetical protein
MNKCAVCGKETKDDSQYVEGKWFHNSCILELQEKYDISNMSNEDKIRNLVNEMRKLLQDTIPTKDDVVPAEEDMSKCNMDSLYDIDIFFSRKPGMRRSVQLISCDSSNKRASSTLSAMTAISSLLETLVSNNVLSAEDIILLFTTYLEFHKDIDVFNELYKKIKG